MFFNKKVFMALILDIKVVPSSGRQNWSVDKSGQIKCFIKSPPEKGLANKELVKLIADSLDVTQSDVEIISGLTSRKKRVKINKNINIDQFLNIIGIDLQKNIFK